MSTRAAGGGPDSGTLIASEQVTGFQADDSRHHKNVDAAAAAHKELKKDAKTSKGKSKGKFVFVQQHRLQA